MVHVIVRHKVSDFNRWKQAFDAHLNARLAAGESGSRVFQSVDDPRDITILLDWNSAEHARRFMGSPDTLSVMQTAGVVGNADVHYVQDVAAVRRTSAD